MVRWLYSIYAGFGLTSQWCRVWVWVCGQIWMGRMSPSYLVGGGDGVCDVLRCAGSVFSLLWKWNRGRDGLGNAEMSNR